MGRVLAHSMEVLGAGTIRVPWRSAALCSPKRIRWKVDEFVEYRVLTPIGGLFVCITIDRGDLVESALR